LAQLVARVRVEGIIVGICVLVTLPDGQARRIYAPVAGISSTCGVRKLDPCDVQDARVAQFVGETELTLHRITLRCLLLLHRRERVLAVLLRVVLVGCTNSITPRVRTRGQGRRGGRAAGFEGCEPWPWVENRFLRSYPAVGVRVRGVAAVG